jgi:hypothetical protein
MKIGRRRRPRVAARSIAHNATDLCEIAAALRALLTSKCDGAHAAFATDLAEIALEVDAVVKQDAVGRGGRSLRVTARRLRWLAWSGNGDAPTRATLLRLAKEMDKETEAGVERPRVAARYPHPALAVPVALAIVACGLYSPLVSRTAATEKKVPVALPAPRTVAAAPAQLGPPMAETVRPEIAAPSWPTASVAPSPVAKTPPRSSNAVAEPKGVDKSEAAAPKPRPTERATAADEARKQIGRFLDAVVPGGHGLPPAPKAGVEKGAAAPPGPRDCMPYLADATLSEPALGLACRNTPGQWQRMSEPPLQERQN